MIRNAVSFACVLLVLSGVTTLAFAWIPAATIRTPSSFRAVKGRGLSTREWWLIGERRAFATVRYQSIVMIRADEYEEDDTVLGLPGWAEMPTPTAMKQMRNPHYELVQAHGWPWPALYYRFSGTGNGRTRVGAVHGGFEVSPWAKGAWYDPRALPYLPIGRGLAADIAVWGVVWLVMLRGPVWFVRARRARAGRCRACGYDISGSSGARCPECGDVRDPPRPAATGTIGR